MFGGHFYHEKIRKSVSIFGRLFNNLYVLRKSKSGSVLNQMKVPLAYAPKQKYLERVRENPDLQNDTREALKLPRMSFEIIGIDYDLTRQLTKVSNFTSLGTDNTNRQKFTSPVPYNIDFQLNIFTNNQDDALQIVEQILPTFNPQYTLTIKPFPVLNPDYKEDIPIIITGVSFADDYEGSLEQRRTIIYTLSFQMKIQFFGNIAPSSIVRKATVPIFDIKSGLIADSDIKLETITVTPNPSDTFGTADSSFGFIEDIKMTQDSGTV